MTCDNSFSVVPNLWRAETRSAFQKALLNQFCPAGLHRKIGLGKSDFLFSGVAVLGDEITGVAAQHDVIHLALAARAEINHFVDVNKMVFDGMAGDFAGGFRLGNGRVEIAPFIVAEQVLQVAGKPVFNAALGLLGVRFKGAGQSLDDIGLHNYLGVAGVTTAASILLNSLSTFAAKSLSI